MEAKKQKTKNQVVESRSEVGVDLSAEANQFLASLEGTETNQTPVLSEGTESTQPSTLPEGAKDNGGTQAVADILVKGTKERTPRKSKYESIQITPEVQQIANDLKTKSLIVLQQTDDIKEVVKAIAQYIAYMKKNFNTVDSTNLQAKLGIFRGQPGFYITSIPWKFRNEVEPSMVKDIPQSLEEALELVLKIRNISIEQFRAHLQAALSSNIEEEQKPDSQLKLFE